MKKIVLTVLLAGLPFSSFTAENIIKIKSRELKCMVDTIYFESRGQPVTGMFAVAHVTLNRVKNSDNFSDTICGVVYQKGQYSWTKIKKKNITESDQYMLALSIADKVLSGESKDPTQGALFFKRGKKIKGMKAKIGDHIFY